MNRTALVLISLGVFTACSSSPKKLTLRESVARPIEENRDAFRECYKNGATEMQSGKVVTEFTVGTQGRVTQAKIKQTTLKNPAIENCILNEIKKIQFTPLPDRKPFVVTYPFTMSVE